MQAIEPLEYGHTYHIYNRGINGADLFTCEANYKHFSHIFNAYAQYFNKLNGRHGGLFETPFRRIRVNTKKYFRQMVFYIHYNPVKHGFVEHISDWKWSSYPAIVSEKPTRLSREAVLEYFDDADNFKAWHQQEHNLRDMGSLLLEV